jgi:hypothetical protein
VAALAICLVVAVLAAWWARTPLWGVLGFALVAGTNAAIFLPARYRLDNAGVTVWFLGVPSQRAWNHYRNAYYHRNLVHLTTLRQPSALDPFRGHSLQFDPHDPQGERQAVKEFIETKLAPFRDKPEN